MSSNDIPTLREAVHILRHDLLELLGQHQRMRAALESIYIYSREDHPPHGDHEALAEGLASGEGCVLCLIEGTAKEGLGE